MPHQVLEITGGAGADARDKAIARTLLLVLHRRANGHRLTENGRSLGLNGTRDGRCGSRSRLSGKTDRQPLLPSSAAVRVCYFSHSNCPSMQGDDRQVQDRTRT